MNEQKMAISDLLDKLNKEKITVAETRKLSDETQVIILVGKMPTFPHGERPAWYSLVLAKGVDHVARQEVEALLRHFWHFEAEFFPEETVMHRKAVLKRK